MAERRVSVRLAAVGGQQVKAELTGIGDAGAASFQRLTREVDVAGTVLRRLAGIVAGAFSVRQVVAYADAWTDLRSRVDLATGSQEKGALVMERLASMARRTYSGLNETAEGWLSVQRSLRDLGLSTRETLDFTEALNNAMVVSGAKGERAAQVQNALAKAMALGKLSGDNLNTVIGSGGRVAELLAEALGTTVSGLRKMGAEGKITGDVIRRALIGNLAKLREEADRMLATIGDAFTIIGNAVMVLIGQWDALIGGSSLVAMALIAVADNLERLAAIGIAFAAFMAGRWVAAFVAARVATLTLSGALVALRGAIIRTGIGALIVAAGELIYWFGQLVKGAGGFGAALKLLKDVANEVFGRIKIGIAGIGQAFHALTLTVAYWWDSMLAGLERKTYDWSYAVIKVLARIAGALDPNKSYEDFMRAVPTPEEVARREGVYDASDAAGAAALKAWGEVRETFGRATAPLTTTGALWDAFGKADADYAAALDDANKASASAAASGSAGRKKKEADEVAKLVGNLRQELSVLRETDPVKKKMLEHSDTLAKATDAEREQVLALVRALDEAKNGFEAIPRALDEYVESARRIGSDIGQALVGAFTRAEDAIAEFVKTGKLKFSELVTSMIADLAKLAARHYILGPLAGMLSGALGRLDPSIGQRLAGVYHSGGIVGGAAPHRMVPALAFAGAPRLHDGGWAGLRPDEVPAILQRGERVLSRREVAGFGAAQVVNVTINARDAASFRQSRTQVAADIARAVALGRRGM